MGNSDISFTCSTQPVGYLNWSLDQEEDIMNSSPASGTVVNDLEPMRVGSTKEVHMKSFDVTTSHPTTVAAAASKSTNTADLSKLPSPSESDSPIQQSSESENPEPLDLQQSIHEALIFTKKMSLVRQQSLRQCASAGAECLSISWFRHIPGRSLKRSMSFGRCVASPDDADTIIVAPLPDSLFSKKKIPSPSVEKAPVPSSPPLEKSSCGPRREKVPSPTTDKISKAKQVPISPRTPSLLSPRRRLRIARRGNKDKRPLTRCLSTPVIDSTFSQRKTIQRCRTAPTERNGTPCFNWESFASEKKENKEALGQQTNNRQKKSKSSLPRRSASHDGAQTSNQIFSIMEQVAEWEQHPPAVKEKSTKPASEDTALDIFNWKAWAKTQSRRNLIDEGSSSSTNYCSTTRKSKRSTLGRQRGIKSERNLSSRKSTCKSLAIL